MSEATGSNDPTKESEDPELTKWMNSTRQKLRRYRLHSKPFSISTVPEKLLKWNENAYIPRAVSVGPRFMRTRRNLLQMNETKWHCTLSLLHRPKDRAPDNLEKCIGVISNLTDDVRASYAGDIKLEKEEDLKDIILYDACFLLELFICGSKNMNEKHESRLKPPGPGPEVLQNEELLSDLLLLENQIPLVILRKLSKQLFQDKDDDDHHHGVGDGDASVETLALNLFGYFPDYRFDSAACNASHLLELVHSYISWESEKNIPEENHEFKHDRSIAIDIESPREERTRCATVLKAAGVEFIPRGEGGSTRGINFHMEFSTGMLKLPSLRITKEMEVRWRNLIAWEQSHPSGLGCKHRCTSTAFFFNNLICCESDIQLLKDREVIIVDHHDSNMMSNQQLLEFFRSMIKGIDRDKVTDSAYWNMAHDLNKYSATNYYAKQFPVILWHSWLPQAIPKIVKFFMRGYNLMLALISILSVIQTYYTILSNYHSKK